MIHLLLHFIFEIQAVREQIDMVTYVIEVIDFRYEVWFNLRGFLEAEKRAIVAVLIVAAGL